jgi:hypothetical protein
LQQSLGHSRYGKKSKEAELLFNIKNDDLDININCDL